MSVVFEMDHPLVRHKLGILRDKRTGTKEFRELVGELAMLLFYEAARGLPLNDEVIETPMARTSVRTLQKKLVAVPILRAGLGMVDGILRVMPSTKIGHIGLYRDSDSLTPIQYYSNLPPDVSECDIVMTDPMLATGGSAAAAAGIIKEQGGRGIKLLSILATPEGISNFHGVHPDIDIYVCEIDERLNNEGMILPGLGDAGDRIFGTV